MDSVKSVIDNIKKIIDDNQMSKLHGGILYSSKETLKKGQIYFMGYNPGGGSDESAIATTLKDDIESLYTKTSNDYVDEEWEQKKYKYAQGEAPLQQRCKFLFEHLDLGIRIEDVCATNLIFAQSPDMNGVSYPTADKCWKVHEYLINNIIKPKIIICMGNGNEKSAYAYLKDRVYKQGKIESLDANHGNYSIKAFKTGEETPKWVIGFPHFSYYKLEGKKNESEIFNWVKEKLDG